MEIFSHGDLGFDIRAFFKIKKKHDSIILFSELLFDDCRIPKVYWWTMDCLMEPK
jgi:hypothetical protein